MSTIQPVAPVKKPLIKLWHKIIASNTLLLSIGLHFLFGVGATVYVVQQIQAKRKVAFQGGPPQINPSTRALEHQVSMAKKKASMSAPAQAKRITTTGLAKIALPDMPTMPHATEVMPNRMAGLGGNGNGFGLGGAGGGMGNGGSGFSFQMPAVMNERCSAASRAAAMASNGGNPKFEAGIIKGLNWLKAHQNADGTYGQEFQGSMTGLALLAYLGHCERPASKDFGPNVRKAIDALCSMGGSGGKLSRIGGNPWAYEHGIGTYALGEAYCLTREAKIAEVLKKAVAIIVGGQGADGGWFYSYSKQSPSDTSVTGWQIQALKAAGLSNLEMDGVQEAMAKAMGDILRVRGPNGGFGYLNPEDKWSLTPVGVFALQTGRHERGLTVRQGLKFALEDASAPKPDWGDPGANVYAWYYLTQACFQHGGSPWHKWNREFMPNLLEHQDADGSWPSTGSTQQAGALSYTGTGGSIDAQVYRTALAILMMEVYYRYLPSSRV